MPLRLGNKKEKRSYLDKGPTKEQVERRNLVRERLFGNDENVNIDDDTLNIPRSPRRFAPPRRSRSETRKDPPRERPSLAPGDKRIKRRSRSMSGLTEMRKSLLQRSKFLSPPPSAPPSPPLPKTPEQKTQLIMNKALKRVVERRKKKENREVLMETIKYEDHGGVHYDSDVDDDTEQESSSSDGTTTNLFYRGLMALEQIYLE